jgi:hypothetical protein
MATKIDTIKEILHAVELLEAAAGWDRSPEWSMSIRDGHVIVECERWPDYDSCSIADELCIAMEAELEQVYKQACRRLEKLGYAEIEHRDSDEYLDDELTANDHYLFSEEGEFDS